MTDCRKGCRRCPRVIEGYRHDFESSLGCKLNGNLNADTGEWVFGDCDNSGRDYKLCGRYQADILNEEAQKIGKRI